MGNREAYESKLEVTKGIKHTQIKIPHHLPVGVCLKQADALYYWCLEDKEALTGVGLRDAS